METLGLLFRENHKYFNEKQLAQLVRVPEEW